MVQVKVEDVALKHNPAAVRRPRGATGKHTATKVTKPHRHLAPGVDVTVSIGNRTEQVRVRDLGKPVWFGRGKKLAKSATRLVVRYEGDAAFRPAERTLDLPPTQR